MFIYSHVILFNEPLAVSSSECVLFLLEVALQQKCSCSKGDFYLSFPYLV